MARGDRLEWNLAQCVVQKAGAEQDRSRVLKNASVVRAGDTKAGNEEGERCDRCYPGHERALIVCRKDQVTGASVVIPVNVAIKIKKLTSGFVRVQKSGAEAHTVVQKFARKACLPMSVVGELVI